MYRGDPPFSNKKATGMEAAIFFSELFSPPISSSGPSEGSPKIPILFRCCSGIAARSPSRIISSRVLSGNVLPKSHSFNCTSSSRRLLSPTPSEAAPRRRKLAPTSMAFCGFTSRCTSLHPTCRNSSASASCRIKSSFCVSGRKPFPQVENWYRFTPFISSRTNPIRCVEAFAGGRNPTYSGMWLHLQLTAIPLPLVLLLLAL
mmetsp:Transcript_5058/g.12793  ORF Transcript_5058/g.12793 Transcript_5058/m.12793 type:complete len:203 (+) Transcript_5058:418-1026(+)